MADIAGLQALSFIFPPLLFYQATSLNIAVVTYTEKCIIWLCQHQRIGMHSLNVSNIVKVIWLSQNLKQLPVNKKSCIFWLIMNAQNIKKQ
jgi:hypothetical protein